MKPIIASVLTFALAAIGGYASSSSIPMEDELTYTPWFTGPLLAPTPINMSPAHPAIEPSFTIFDNYGRYDDNWSVHRQDSIWTLNPFLDFQFGITDNLGVETLVSFVSNFQNGRASSHFQDTVVLFGYQISNDEKGSWVPDFRLILQETFPTGKYQKLNPDRLGIETTGLGSFQTGPVLVFRKLFYLPHSFFSLRWSVGYLFPATVNVKGFNTYGGGYGAKGKVKPGQNLTAFLSGEYSFNQKWVMAFDTEIFYQKKSRFSGNPGVVLSGEPAAVGLPSSWQISFAPEIEYNFSPVSGLLAGLWFTVAGKNSNAFGAAFLAYLYIF